MAHYAYLDENNIVTAVIVGKDETELIDGLDPETYYGAIRTSFNGKIRYNFAGVGYTYDKDADAFIAPRPQCNHKELFLTDNFKWNCQRCAQDEKNAIDEAQTK